MSEAGDRRRRADVPLTSVDAPARGAPFLEWAVARRPRPGELACGDRAVVHVDDVGAVIVVADGLGHGPDAARAADLVAGVVAEAVAARGHGPAGAGGSDGRPASADAPPDVLLRRIHAALGNSRGAAVTVAVLDAATGRMEWLGVGNVDGVVVRADDLARPRTHGVFLRGGVVGHEMPDLHRAEPVALHAGDTLVIATDGVRGDLAEAAMTDLLADRLARRVLAEKASPTDDALVLVARFRPRRPPASPPRGTPAAAAADVPEAPPAAAPGTGSRP